MNNLEEDDDVESEEGRVAKETLTDAQRAKLRFVCDQLGTKYRTPNHPIPDTDLPKVVLNKKTKDDKHGRNLNGDDLSTR